LFSILRRCWHNEFCACFEQHGISEPCSVTSTLKVFRGRHVGVIGIKTEHRNQVVIREAPGLNLDWELGYSSSVVFLIPSGQLPGLFLNVGYDRFLPL
jgi:hypothetical protein